MKKFKIKNLCPYLDGMIAWSLDSQQNILLKIERLEQKNELMETFSIPVSGMWIASENLDLYDDSEKEYATDNPYGKFISRRTVFKDGIDVSVNIYENAISVKIIESSTNKTLYAQSFFDFEKIERVVSHLGTVESADMENLIFDLKEIE